MAVVERELRVSSLDDNEPFRAARLGRL